VIRIPSATYRLQLHSEFGFDEVARIAPYLARLGISELYLSPIFKAAPGSTHGYDVLDHDVLNPELGGKEAFERLTHIARQHDLGVIVDFVPNHMGVGVEGNRFWEDVLEHGQASERASHFDIDWEPPKETLAHKLLLPILPEQYGACLEKGYFSLHFANDGITLRAGERTLPLRPKSLGRVLSRVADLLEAQVSAAVSDELRLIGADFAALNDTVTNEPAALEAYRRAARAARHRLAELVRYAELQLPVERALAELSGDASAPASFDFMDELLRAQHYRLSAWQLALEAINYRRFFDVNALASIRIEDPNVFEATHRRLFALIEAGAITGVRLDHIDGLRDPIGYLRQLDERLHELTGAREAAEIPLYVVVEKILAPGETLPASFRAHGTTGYEFARIASGVFVDRRAEQSLSSSYRRFTGDHASFDDHELRAKRDVLASLLVSEAMTLSRALERLAEEDRRWRDLTLFSLHGALVETMAAFPVYRSYVRADGSRTPEDEAAINHAIATAIRRNPTGGRGPYQFLRSLLLGESSLPGALEFALRFQQTTAPVTAKALEDTAFYRYTRNICDNEVGARPDRLGVELDEFHAHNAHTQSELKLSLNATSTHDTKRGEDARARLSMLSELPNTWRRLVFQLSRAAAKHRSAYQNGEAPARTDEYLFYQTLVGVFPFGATQGSFEALAERVQAYMRKAVREAKTHTSWLHPEEEYERALSSFIAGALADEAFTAPIRSFCRRIESHAASKALGQVVLKLCAPGVPDTYQGAELWHQVLVDPDNRRPVDYSAHLAALADLDARRSDRASLLPELLADFPSGKIKLFLTSELLRLRSTRPAPFHSGYTPLEAGPCCLAFARGPRSLEDPGFARACELVCVVPRFPFRVTRGRARWPMGAVWEDARISHEGLRGKFRNVLSQKELSADGSLPLAEVLADFPVAVLLRLED